VTNLDTILSKLLDCRRRILWSDGRIVPVPNTDQIREALMFSQFRFKLIEFLKLPSDIREPVLRSVLQRTSGGVCRNYLARAERVHRILMSEEGVGNFEVTRARSTQGTQMAAQLTAT